MEELKIQEESASNTVKAGRKVNKSNKKYKSKNTTIKKRSKKESEIQAKKNTRKSKKQKIEEEELEEEKETKEEKDQKEEAKMDSLHQPILHYKDRSEALANHIIEKNHTVHYKPNFYTPTPQAERPCLSVNSLNHEGQLNEEQYLKMDGANDQRHSFNLDISKIENYQLFEMSDNDYSQECRELEQKLLEE